MPPTLKAHGASPERNAPVDEWLDLTTKAIPTWRTTQLSAELIVQIANGRRGLIGEWFTPERGPRPSMFLPYRSFRTPIQHTRSTYRSAMG
jgi:hypothetical protein